MSTLGVSFTDAALESRVLAGVDDVEAQLTAAVQSPDALVSEAAAHLLNAGGKRFRPLLTLLSAEFGDTTHPDVARSAVVVELTHLATLYHDDVMDEADKRRGAPSANERWSNSVAILIGDYLFAQASELVSYLGPEAVRIQARTFSRLVQGQIRETIGPAADEDALAHYLAVVADKTGSLIATAALFGAKMAGASTEVQETLTEFGERIGAAFQLADDIIDVASASARRTSSPTTSSTSRARPATPARPPAPICARASRRSPPSSRCAPPTPTASASGPCCRSR